MDNSEIYETKKSLGQHWLKDVNILIKIASYAQIEPGEKILEIGPGPGYLTQILLEQKADILAIELDVDLAARLRERFAVPNLKVINQDILKFDFKILPNVYKIVANIPYYLTSNLIRLLCDADNPPDIAVLLVQKEVAQRVAAKPGDMSILSVAAQTYFNIDLGDIVRAEYFTPAPKVDSQNLILKKLDNPKIDKKNSKDFFRLVKAGFSERRKKLRSSLNGGLNIPKTEVDNLLNAVGLSSDLRAQNLSLDDWLKLFNVWKSRIK